MYVPTVCTLSTDRDISTIRIVQFKSGRSAYMYVCTYIHTLLVEYDVLQTVIVGQSVRVCICGPGLGGMRLSEDVPRYRASSGACTVYLRAL